MPDTEPTIQWSDERVIFENWLDDGCHIFVDHKHVLTLNTPESTNDEESSCCFMENWISPDEFCANLAAVLRAFGASPTVLAAVEMERRHYRESPVNPPQRSNRDLLRGIGVVTD